MKKTNWLKKILSFVLAIVMVACMIQVPAKAEAVTYTDMTIDSFYTNGAAWYEPTLSNGNWRVYLKTSGELPDGTYDLIMSNGTQEITVSFWKDGSNVLGTETIPQTFIDGCKAQTIAIKKGQYQAGSTGTGINLTQDFVFYVNGYSWSTDVTKVTPSPAQKVTLTLNMNPSGNNSTGGDATGFYMTANFSEDAYIDLEWNQTNMSALQSTTDGSEFHQGGIFENATKTAYTLEKYGDKLYYIWLYEGATVGAEYTVKGLFQDKDGIVVGFLPITVVWDGTTWSQKDLGVLEIYESSLCLGTWKQSGATTIQLKGTDNYLLGVGNDMWDNSYTLLTPDSESGIFLGGNVAIGATLRKYNGDDGLYFVENLSGVEDGSIVTIKGTFYSENGKTKFVYPETKVIYDVETTSWADWTMPIYEGTLTKAGAEGDGTYDSANWFTLLGTDTYTPDDNDDAKILKAAESDAESGIFVGTADSLGEKQPNGAVKKYFAAANYYNVEGIPEASTGTVITIKGTFYSQDGLAAVTFTESKFIYDGSKWSDYADISTYESILTLDGTGWYGANANNTGTALYVHGTDTYLPEAGEAWSGDDRTLVADNADSGVFFGTEKQESARIIKLVGGVEAGSTTHIYYIEGFNASEGTVLTVKGSFTTADGKAKINFAETSFKFTGSAWEAYVEIPTYDSTLTLDGTGWYGANANNTGTALYVHGTDTYLPEAGEAWSGDDRTLVADNADSGVFFGTEKQESARIIKLVGGVEAGSTTHIYYIEGFNASEGTVLTVKGSFTTADGKAKINLAEASFKFTGSAWEVYTPFKGNTYNGTLKINGTGMQSTSLASMYLKGSDAYLNDNDKEIWIGEDRRMKANADDQNSGIFVGEVKQENGLLIKLKGTSNLYWAEGFTATANDIVTIRGTFYTEDGNTAITFAKACFQYVDGAWTDAYTGLDDTGVQHDVNSDLKVSSADLVRLIRHRDNNMISINDAQKDINYVGGVGDAEDEDSLRKVLVGMIYYKDGEVYGTPVYSKKRVIEKMAYVCPELGSWNTEKTVYTPKTDAEIDEILTKYKEAGLTLINTENRAQWFGGDINALENQPIKLYLEKAQKHGLGVLVWDDSIQYMLTQKNPEVYNSGDWTWQKEIDNHVQQMSAYDSFRGFMLWDELTIDYAETYNKVVSYIHETYPELMLVTSQLPITAYDQESRGPGALTTDTTTNGTKELAYKDYIWNYAKDLGHFTYNLYPLLYTKETGLFASGSEYGIHNDWYLNLQYVAELAKEKNYAFTTGITVQACQLTTQELGNFFSGKDVTPYAPAQDSDVGFQVYTAMAYGMKEIHYFSYEMHWGGADANVVNGMLDGAYTYVKNVNAEIDKFANVYQSFSWKDTLDVSAGSTNASTSNSRLTSVKAENARAFIGCMKDTDGFDGYMVSNADGPRENITSKVTLTFNDATQAIVYTNGVAETVTLTNGVCTVEVPSGEGVFVIPLR